MASSSKYSVASKNNQGSNPASTYDKAGNTANKPLNNSYNIVKDYTWTLTPRRNINNLGEKDSINDVPYVYLTEYSVDESFIKAQAAAFSANAEDTTSGTVTGIINAVTGFKLPAKANTNEARLKPYESLYPRTSPTKNIYIFPYFDDINFEINTPAWESIDALAAASGIGGSISDALFGKNSESVKDIASNIKQYGSLALANASPKVAALDRPRLWSSHTPRSINIKFPLFNTRYADDWIKNRELCKLLVRQNLFQKLDTVCNIPPVFYEIVIPGQHYSYASCVTRLTINNKGNMHTFTDPSNNNATCVVPDAYEVNITLEDLVMPSQNLFDSIDGKQAEVTTAVKAPALQTKVLTPTNEVQTLPAKVGTVSLNSPILNYGPTK